MRGCVMLGAGGHLCMGRAHEWGTTVRGGVRACTLMSRGAASIVSKITATGPEAAVEQRSAIETPKKARGAGTAFGPRFGGQVQRTPICAEGEYEARG
jgi:hypothetical protein